MERNQRRPPDVEEALSSMLWTPYERTPSESSSDEDEKLNTKLKKSKSSFDYAFPTTHYVPSYRKFERYDNFRFSYPYYGPFPSMPKCITEPPSYESLYHNVTPALSNITGISGRLVHSFTDNFITQNPPTPPLMPQETTAALLNITNSVSGFPGSFADYGPTTNQIASSLCNESSALSITSLPFLVPPEVSLRENSSREELLSSDNRRDPLLGADDFSLRKQQSRGATVQTITTSSDRTDLPEEPRVSKPGRQYGSSTDSYSPRSRDLALAVVVAATNNDGIKGNRETSCVLAAQTDHEHNIELSLRSIFEEGGSAVISAGTYSDVVNYIDVVDSVSSESVGFRNLAVNVRNKLLAMRLNVPAAASVSASKDSSVVFSANSKENASKTTTSVFLSAAAATAAVRCDSNNQTSVTAAASTTTATMFTRRNMITNGTLKGAIVPPQPSLTIQVNQSNEICSRNQLASDQPRDIVNQSSGIISVVNCYSSSVPRINSVSNESVVGIVPNVVTATTASATTTTTTTTITGHIDASIVSGGDINNFCRLPINGNTRLRTLERTFTSTESQTDDMHNLDHHQNDFVNPNISSGVGSLVQSQTEALITREQRRRERRERRGQGRNRHPHILTPPPPPVIRPILPDILHSHFPPPYTALSLTNPPPPPSSLIAPVISTVPITATAINDGRFTIPLPVIRRSPSERSGKGCCGQWFAGPPLRALIAVVALGGVACALGGAALGATGLAGPPTSHLTAALLMIGVGVILVTVSGAAWRMTAPGGPPCLGFGSTVDLGRCGRRPCSSRGAPHGLLYPEFQHRPPPPSYQASMQEYRLRLLLLDRDRQNGVVRGGSPPPTYRSHAGSLLRTPLSTTTRGGGGGGGNGSSIGGPGSEYSLPPSYRSRNTNGNNTNSSRPPTVFGDESMESLGSNNLDTLSSRGNVPEHDSIHSTASSSDHQTSDFSPIVGGIISRNRISSTSTSLSSPSPSPPTKDPNSIIEGINHADSTLTLSRESLEVRSQNLNEKFNPRVISSDNISCINSSSPSCKSPSKSEQSCAAANRREMVTIVTISASQGPDESQSEMDILAHL